MPSGRTPRTSTLGPMRVALFVGWDVVVLPLLVVVVRELMPVWLGVVERVVEVVVAIHVAVRFLVEGAEGTSSVLPVELGL